MRSQMKLNGRVIRRSDSPFSFHLFLFLVYELATPAEPRTISINAQLLLRKKRNTRHATFCATTRARALSLRGAPLPWKSAASIIPAAHLVRRNNPVRALAMRRISNQLEAADESQQPRWLRIRTACTIRFSGRTGASRRGEWSDRIEPWQWPRCPHVPSAS